MDTTVVTLNVMVAPMDHALADIVATNVVPAVTVAYNNTVGMASLTQHPLYEQPHQVVLRP